MFQYSFIAQLLNMTEKSIEGNGKDDYCSDTNLSGCENLKGLV
tara:strand:+ start:433 stop:561 length:129 start_codon:yes stop_codon:yes gene_type:complete